MRLPCRPAAAIFDMDGTLLDTEAVHRAATMAAADAFGIAFPDALYQQMVGVHRDRNIALLRGHFGEDFAVERFYDEADARFDRLWRDGVPLRPGARTLLDRLATRGLPLALCTSTASPAAEQRLAAAGLDRCFAAVVTRSDVARPKPAADPYALAAQRLGVPAAACLAVEDSPNGLRAAVAAGMTTILVPDLVPATAETRALAFAVLPDLSAVAALIEYALAQGGSSTVHSAC